MTTDVLAPVEDEHERSVRIDASPFHFLDPHHYDLVSSTIRPRQLRASLELTRLIAVIGAGKTGQFTCRIKWTLDTAIAAQFVTAFPLMKAEQARSLA